METPVAVLLIIALILTSVAVVVYELANRYPASPEHYPQVMVSNVVAYEEREQGFTVVYINFRVRSIEPVTIETVSFHVSAYDADTGRTIEDVVGGAPGVRYSWGYYTVNPSYYDERARDATLSVIIFDSYLGAAPEDLSIDYIYMTLVSPAGKKYTVTIPIPGEFSGTI